MTGVPGSLADDRERQPFEPDREPAMSTVEINYNRVRRQLSICGASARCPGSSSISSIMPPGGDALRQIPSQRWNPTPLPTPACRFGAFVLQADRFDNAIFGLSSAESSAIDPQQRLLLEHGYAALHAAYERRETLSAADIGIFLGIMHADFNEMLVGNGSVYEATGGSLSIAAGRVSFVLGMQGPCVSYDTACSSALVAAHAAASAMHAHECETSLVLAASLMLSPKVRTELSQPPVPIMDSRSPSKRILLDLTLCLLSGARSIRCRWHALF